MIILMLVLAYVVGSIPFAYIVTKVYKKKDIRKVGSGNVGATNVYRVSKGLGAIVLALDMAKAAFPIIYLSRYNIETTYLYAIGLAIVIGHVFTPWLKFKGGKGVAAVVGVYIALNEKILCAFLLVWIAVFIRTRYVSLASITAIIAAELMCIITENIPTTLIVTLISALVVVKHRENIVRLRQGEEKKT